MDALDYDEEEYEESQEGEDNESDDEKTMTAKEKKLQKRPPGQENIRAKYKTCLADEEVYKEFIAHKPPMPYSYLEYILLEFDTSPWKWLLATCIHSRINLYALATKDIWQLLRTHTQLHDWCTNLCTTVDIFVRSTECSYTVGDNKEKEALNTLFIGKLFDNSNKITK